MVAREAAWTDVFQRFRSHPPHILRCFPCHEEEQQRHLLQFEVLLWAPGSQALQQALTELER